MTMRGQEVFRKAVRVTVLDRGRLEVELVDGPTGARFTVRLPRATATDEPRR